VFAMPLLLGHADTQCLCGWQEVFSTVNHVFLPVSCKQICKINPNIKVLRCM